MKNMKMPAAPEAEEMDLGLEEFASEEEAAGSEEEEMVKKLEDMGYTVLPPEGDEEGEDEEVMDLEEGVLEGIM